MAKPLVQAHGGNGKKTTRLGGQRCIACQFKRRHFVLATWFQSGFYRQQPLASPEPEQQTAGFCANEQHGAIGEVDQMAPLDRSDEPSGREDHPVFRTSAPVVQTSAALRRYG